MKDISTIEEFEGFTRIEGLKRCKITRLISGVSSDFYSEKHLTKFNIVPDKTTYQITLLTNTNDEVKRAFTPSTNSMIYNFFKGASVGDYYDVLFSNGKILHAVRSDLKL